MAQSPIIKTARLRLVPFQERHLSEQYLSWLNDRELMRYSEQRHQRHSLASCRDYWQSFINTPNYFWAIEETESGLDHIGNINAYVNEPNRVADIGILIGEKTAHHRGYALEAWLGVCRYLFEHVKIRKISAGTLAANVAMRSVMARAGMVADGVRKRHYLVDGTETDLIHMALFSSGAGKGTGGLK